MKVDAELAGRLATADPDHFRVHPRMPEELVYWRPSTDQGWVPVFEIGGAVSWWMLGQLPFIALIELRGHGFECCYREGVDGEGVVATAATPEEATVEAFLRSKGK